MIFFFFVMIVMGISTWVYYLEENKITFIKHDFNFKLLV